MGKTVSLNEWDALFVAADAIKKQAPWNWMYDSDLFAVEDSKTGEIGYVSVMGALGEHFAIGVYLGGVGLAGFIKIMNGGIEKSDEMDVLGIQNCLMGSFEDRIFLDKQDKDLILQLKRSYRGKNAWPQFRWHEPGFMPQHLTTESHVIFLREVFEQTLIFAERFKENPDLVRPRRDGNILLRKKDKNGFWKEEWIIPVPEESSIHINQISPTLLEKLKKQTSRSSLVCELDISSSPFCIGDKHTRASIPFISFLVDHESGYVFDTYVAEQKSIFCDFPSHLIEIMSKIGVRPQEILIKKEEFVLVLEELCRALEIKLTLVNHLPEITLAKRHMNAFFKERK